MPFYHDSVFGPSEDSQLRPPAPALTSPMDDRPRPALRRTSLPPPEESDDSDQDNSPRRPFRVPREVMSPAPSPIPISPTYYSYRNDDEEAERDERGEAAAAEEMVEEADELEVVDVRRASRHHRQQQERTGGKSSRGGPVQASEKYVSIPRNGRDASAFSDEEEDDSVGQDDDDQVDVEKKDRRSRRHAGLVSSRPRSSPQKRAERASLAVSAAPSPSAPARATDYVQEDRGEGEVRRPHRGSRHASSRRAASRSRHRHHRDPAKVGSSSDSASDVPPHRSDEETESEGEEDDERHEKRRRRHAHSPKASPSRKSRQLRSTPEMHCRRCGYLLPAEMAAYVLETSAYASVPQPHCPACGSRLKNTTPASDAEEDGENRLRQRRGSEVLHRTAAPTSAPPHRSAVRRHAGEQEVNLYSDPEAEELGPRGARTRTVAAAQPGRPQPSLSPSSLPTKMLVPKSPYLTLEFMPHTLSSTMRKQSMTQPQDRYAVAEEDNIGVGKAPPVDLEHTGVPWATPGCSACCWQCGVSLAGVCCCCAMPCVLFRERQQLLFHELESRYICCAGAFPCCVPPASLRPELYYTAQAVPPTRMRSSNYWEDAVEVSHDGAEASGGGGQLAAPATSTAPRRATLRSATGIASPSSLVNPRTGLPLEGCYHNTNASHGAHGSAGTGCCDCVSCVDHTCVWDCSKGCCLACTHPTAHCLACPLCCLCCELTCCMPCALWANRLLIRQHYNLAPDPSIDAGAACCYSCCLTCCTCQAVSVVSKHHASAQQQQQQQRSSRAVANASSLSCWSQLATSVAACLAAVCCLCPCAACSLAQQRDQRERLGYPLVVNMPPEMEML